jgi:hypothetical protein
MHQSLGHGINKIEVARNKRRIRFLGLVAGIFPQQRHVVGHHLTYTFTLPGKSANLFHFLRCAGLSHRGRKSMIHAMKHACTGLGPMAPVRHIERMLADEQLSREQIEALRAMSGQDRLRIAQRLYWSARRMKAAGVRAQHADWPEAKVDDEVRRIFCNART